MVKSKTEKRKDYNFDIYGLDERVSNFEKRITSSGMLLENKNHAISFKKKVHAAGLMGKQRILKYEIFFKNYDMLLKKPFDKATRADLEEMISYVKDRGDWMDSTKNDFLRLLKRYYKITAGMEDEREHPELVRWIKIKKEKQPPINWENVPHWEDIIKMAEHTHSLRDRFLVKCCFEAGTRISELLTLTVGSCEEVEHGIYLNIRESKTKLRKVFIRLSAPDLLEYLSTHPLKHNKEAPLFCKLNGGDYWKVISHGYVYKMMKRLKEHAGIDKRITPHALRHGSASYFSDWLSDSDMDNKFGWSEGDTKKRYTHKNPRAVEDKVLKMAGVGGGNGVINIYKEAEKKQVECYYCHKPNDPDRKICWNCRRVLDISTAETVQKLKEKADNLGFAYLEENSAAFKGFMDFLSNKAEERIQESMEKRA